MPKLPLAATAVASILVTLATGSIAQTLPPNLPLAIICFNEKTQTWRIGYLDESRRMVLRPTSLGIFGLR
jgi:hypothetical protein